MNEIEMINNLMISERFLLREGLINFRGHLLSNIIYRVGKASLGPLRIRLLKCCCTRPAKRAYWT